MPYVLQAGINGVLYHRHTVFAGTLQQERDKANKEARRIKAGGRLPNESVAQRIGNWREDRLFHPDWARIVYNNRVEWHMGNCPADLNPPLVRPLPGTTTLKTTLASLGSRPTDDLTRRKLRSKARRDIKAAREELARCLAVYKSLKS